MDSDREKLVENQEYGRVKFTAPAQEHEGEVTQLLH